MHYTVYKITNKLNNKIYIGTHITHVINDSYMGSGKLIKRAIKKYGVECFNKEILFVFDNEEDMFLKEKELVILGENSYNLCPGGQGGFGYINKNKDLIEKRDRREHKIAGAIAKNKIYNKIRTTQAVEKYLLNPKLCLKCNSIIPWKRKENKFCNSSCFAHFENRRRKLNNGLLRIW